MPPVNIRHAGLRSLGIFLVIFFFTYRYAASISSRDPGSRFYQPERAFDRFYSSIRQSQGRRYLEYVQENATPFLHSGHQTPRLCATFLTFTRPIDEQYLPDAVSSLLDGMTPAERDDLDLRIFFAQSDPETHPDWSERWPRLVADDVFTYTTDAVAEYRLNEAKWWEYEKDVQLKATWDYAAALDRCFQNSSSPYIAVLEDDILLAKGWLARTMAALQDADRTARRVKTDWLYLRTFNQERSTGWSSSRIGGNGELFIAAIVSSLFYVGVLAMRPRSRWLRRWLDPWSVAVICWLAIPSFLVLFYQTGKATVLPPTPGLRVEQFGCCSQALVFKRRQVPALMQWLHAYAGQYDMLINGYAADMNLARLSLYPMQTQHVGVVPTTNPQRSAEDAQAVWSMAFEQLDPRWIEKSHRAAVKRLYKT